jgi:tetratricopeptide (TPR) repeat protein
MDVGSYREALALAKHIRDPSYRAAILIDAGFGANKSGSIREGVSILEDLLSRQDGLRKSAALSSILYNAANGYYSIYMLRKRRRKSTVPPNDNDLRLAKVYYREALSSLDHEEPAFRSQLYVNYANCLSQFGRGVESIKYYLRALEADPTNGMAAGNLGMELYNVAHLTGRYFHDYIDLAHQYLSRALGPDMHLRYGSAEAARSFESTLQILDEIIQRHDDFYEGLSALTEPDISEEMRAYIRFCREHSLLLNAWVGDPRREPANTDGIVYNPIVTDFDDEETVPELVRILNEIKESFASARYLYYLSTTGSSQIDDASKMTLYFQTTERSLNGLYIGLCKSAYSRAFDVLDKVAKIIHVYFGIGKREDHFWSIFAKRQSMGQERKIRFVAPPEITKRENLGLYALSDICIDYFESQHVDLKTIDHRRNLITHDYLNVLPEEVNRPLEPNEIHARDLFQQTLTVLRLAKNAILYAVISIQIAESKKGASRTIPREYSHDHGVLSEDLPNLR